MHQEESKQAGVRFIGHLKDVNAQGVLTRAEIIDPELLRLKYLARRKERIAIAGISIHRPPLQTTSVFFMRSRGRRAT